jgi:23S rRNA (guanosine2251-2'-O)-methyltransferase
MKHKPPKKNDSRHPARSFAPDSKYGKSKDKTAAKPTNLRKRRPGKSRSNSPDKLWLFGMHTVRAALSNPKRQKFRLLATENALARINVAAALFAPLEAELVETARLNNLAGSDAVHQGVMLQVAPLPASPIEDMIQNTLVIVLDQITDPHNVGAIMRTSVAMNAGAVITTNRHSAHETAVLAKSASGALDMIEYIQVGNLSKAIAGLSSQGYFCIGLDSEGPAPLEKTFSLARNGGSHIALVLGAEGQGLRKKARDTCDALARLDMPGLIKSLNVSNAAAIALYAARQHLDERNNLP